MISTRDAIRRVSNDDINAIPGWFWPHDVTLFHFFLTRQDVLGFAGDLAELGVYMGKSAVLLGAAARPDECFTVVDLFGEEAGTGTANISGNRDQYPGLTRTAFERYYRSVHATLPRVIQGSSASIENVSEPSSHRFLHIDASHLYENVRKDVNASQKLLRADGIVVLDGYRSPHTPGVASAVWEAVAQDGLVPLVVSESKFYGTCEHERIDWYSVLAEWLPESGFAYEEQSVRGHRVWRVWVPPRPSRADFVPPICMKGLRWFRGGASVGDVTRRAVGPISRLQPRGSTSSRSEPSSRRAQCTRQVVMCCVCRQIEDLRCASD